MPRRASKWPRWPFAIQTLVFAFHFVSFTWAQAEPPASVDEAIQQAKLHIRENQFDQAIEVLTQSKQMAGSDVTKLREVYLLSIKSYVSGGNYYALQVQGRTTSELFYKRAEELTRECLGNYELRDTVAEPAQEYPPEMHAMLDRVRRELFGELHATMVEPADAEILLDGRILPRQADGAVRESNLMVGPHELEIRREGYETWTESIVISPASTLERSFTLEKRRGWVWMITRIGVPVAAVAGVVALLVGGGSEEPDPEPLPGPPPPPAD